MKTPQRLLFLRRRGFFLVVSLAVAVLPMAASAQVEVRRPLGRVTPWPELPAGYHAVLGSDPNLPFDDLEPLAEMLGNASFVALGESVHASGGFYEAKHRVLRYLVEERGFRAFGIESPWEPADRVGAYVTTGEGTAEDALYGLYNVWQAQSVLDMVEWMREWNGTHPEDPVHFFGFDVMHANQDGAALLACLHDVHPDVASLAAGITSCAGAGDGNWRPINEADHLACLATLDEVQAFFEDNRDDIIAASSEEELDSAWIRLVSLQSHQGFVWGWTVDDIEAAYQSRDWGMAEVFIRIHRLRFSGLKTVIWAHNWHIAQNTPVMETDAEFGVAASMGTHLAAELGTDYAPVALAAHRTRIHWPWFEPEPLEFVFSSGVEPRLHEYQRTALLVDSTAPALCPPDETCLWTWPDRAITPSDWAMWEFVFDPPEQFRAVLFLDVSREMIPLGHH